MGRERRPRDRSWQQAIEHTLAELVARQLQPRLRSTLHPGKLTLYDGERRLGLVLFVLDQELELSVSTQWFRRAAPGWISRGPSPMGHYVIYRRYELCDPQLHRLVVGDLLRLWGYDEPGTDLVNPVRVADDTAAAAEFAGVLARALGADLPGD